jgi:protoheme ferro-lyase
METLCKLTIKQHNEPILKQCYRTILEEAQYKGKNYLIPSIAKMLLRVRRLRCEKVIIVFLRPIVSYLS